MFASVANPRARARTTEEPASEVVGLSRSSSNPMFSCDVNPVIDPALDASGALTFRNAAVAAGVAKPPASYEVAWFVFDNATGASTPIGQPIGSLREGGTAPSGLPTADGSFVRADIKALDAANPSWAAPVRAFFRRTGPGWKLVGFERLAETARR